MTSWELSTRNEPKETCLSQLREAGEQRQPFSALLQRTVSVDRPGTMDRWNF